jgi:hypothetical protein
VLGSDDLAGFLARAAMEGFADPYMDGGGFDGFGFSGGAAGGAGAVGEEPPSSGHLGDAPTPEFVAEAAVAVLVAMV